MTEAHSDSSGPRNWLDRAIQPATPVNDSQTLTHEMVTAAIRTSDSLEAARLMREYADECDRVGATALALDLRRYAADRMTGADLSAVDRTADALLATLADCYPSQGSHHGAACLAALEVVYADVPRVVLAERIAAAQLARSIGS
jgi:hypothetical protein